MTRSWPRCSSVPPTMYITWCSWRAGPAANGMILSSRQRLLAYMRAGDADGAALEMEKHLRGLHFMSRLVGDNPKTGMIKTRRAGAVARQMFAESAHRTPARAQMPVGW